MAVWSIIKKSELEGASRIDSEYYQPEYLFNENVINRIENDNIGSISLNISYGTTPQGGEFVRDSRNSVPFIRSQNFNLLSINTDGIVYCNRNHHIKNKKSTIYPQDILFAAVGATIGQLAIVQNEIREGNINQNIARIRIKDKRFSSSYIAFFFYSKYGQNQINRYITGNAQFYLNSTQIASFRVPVLKDIELFDNYLNKIQDLIFQSKSLYSQAEQILLEELGLKDLGLKDDLFYTTTLKEVKNNNRVDTEYYMPKYEKLMEHIFSFNYNLLGKLAKFKKGVEPGSDKYFITGKPFIRVSNLSKFGIINNNQKYLENNLYIQLKKSYEPKKGEILLSKDATPGVAYVLKESIEGIISSGILRLEIASSIKKEYLALIINSQIGQMQMKRDSGGSIINHWKIEEIKNLKVPLLADNTQKKIENLCCESFLKRKQALLEQAKHKVEEMIEKEAGVE